MLITIIYVMMLVITFVIFYGLRNDFNLDIEEIIIYSMFWPVILLGTIFAILLSLCFSILGLVFLVFEGIKGMYSFLKDSYYEGKQNVF